MSTIHPGDLLHAADGSLVGVVKSCGGDCSKPREVHVHLETAAAHYEMANQTKLPLDGTEATRAKERVDRVWADRLLPRPELTHQEELEVLARRLAAKSQECGKLKAELCDARDEVAGSKRAVDAVKALHDASEEHNASLTLRLTNLQGHYRQLQLTAFTMLQQAVAARAAAKKAEAQLEHTCNRFAELQGPKLNEMEAEITRLRTQLAGTQAGVPFTQH